MYRGITTASASFHVCVVDTGHKYDLEESWVDVGGGHFGPHFKNLINKNRLGFNYLSFQKSKICSYKVGKQIFFADIVYIKVKVLNIVKSTLYELLT